MAAGLADGIGLVVLRAVVCDAGLFARLCDAAALCCQLLSLAIGFVPAAGFYAVFSNPSSLILPSDAAPPSDRGAEYKIDWANRYFLW